MKVNRLVTCLSAKRQDIIETAIQLFARDGFHATGIDRIADQAQVSKKTLYHHFRSKEELILAALKQHDGLFRNFFMKSVQQLDGSPHDRLLGIFDVAEVWFGGREFYGCMFINAIGEYSNRETAIRRACQEFKSQMASFIEELVIAAGIHDVKTVTSSLTLLLEGAIVTAQVSGDQQAAANAKAAAKLIVSAAELKS